MQVALVDCPVCSATNPLKCPEHGEPVRITLRQCSYCSSPFLCAMKMDIPKLYQGIVRLDGGIISDNVPRDVQEQHLAVMFKKLLQTNASSFRLTIDELKTCLSEPPSLYKTKQELKAESAMVILQCPACQGFTNPIPNGFCFGGLTVVCNHCKEAFSFTIDRLVPLELAERIKVGEGQVSGLDATVFFRLIEH